MKLNRWFLGVFVTLSVCFGQELETSCSDKSMLRAALRYAVELPLTNVAINTVPNGLTFKQSAQYIRATKGILGFYSGTPIEILRSALWYPRMKAMETPYPLGLGMDQYNRNISIATNLAAFEMAFMPLFRLRNACMLSTVQEIKESMMTPDFSLYAGGYLRGATTFISWYSFFKAQDFAKEQFADNSAAQVGFVTATQMAVGAVTSPLYLVMINRRN